MRSRFAVRLENCFSHTSVKRASTLRLIEVITALRELCRGRTAGKIAHAPQLLPEEP